MGIQVHYDAAAFLSSLKTNNHAFLVADFMLEMTKEYGNAFQVRLLTDNRVRVFVPCP